MSTTKEVSHVGDFVTTDGIMWDGFHIPRGTKVTTTENAEGNQKVFSANITEVPSSKALLGLRPATTADRIDWSPDQVKRYISGGLLKARESV